MPLRGLERCVEDLRMARIRAADPDVIENSYINDLVDGIVRRATDQVAAELECDANAIIQGLFAQGNGLAGYTEADEYRDRVLVLQIKRKRQEREEYEYRNATPPQIIHDHIPRGLKSCFKTWQPKSCSSHLWFRKVPEIRLFTTSHEPVCGLSTSLNVDRCCVINNNQKYVLDSENPDSAEKSQQLQTGSTRRSSRGDNSHVITTRKPNYAISKSPQWTNPRKNVVSKVLQRFSRAVRGAIRVCLRPCRH